MNIRSLLLGSVAAVGLATGAHAADLAKGVMTSLDVCDALGLSGLTVSSDTNCLQVSGGVSYMFAWGDYVVGPGSDGVGEGIVRTASDVFRIPLAGDAFGTVGRQTDWESQMIAWLQVVGTADSDFGPAKVVIKLQSEAWRQTYNGFGFNEGDDTGFGTTNVGAPGEVIPYGNGPSGTITPALAYVSVGDTTVISAGLMGSIVNTDDDNPLNYLGLFNSDTVAYYGQRNGGVLWSVNPYAGGAAYANVQTGGHSIQVVSSLGNGVTLRGGLEDLNDATPSRAGTAIGVISYAGDNLTAHLSVVATGILDGRPDTTAYHAGFTGTFDKFKVVGAIAGDSTGFYDALASAQMTFDMFKLAASGEATHTSGGINGVGAGASATVTVSDGVSINIGGRYFDSDTSRANDEGYQGAISLVAALTETLTLTGEVGVYGQNSGGIINAPAGNSRYGDVGTVGTYTNTEYGAVSVAWAPGGGFTSSLKGEAYSNGAYRATFNAAKNFQ